MASGTAEGELEARRILIVEDELLIGMHLEELLESHGLRVLGPAPTVKAALGLLDLQRPDAALLDYNLRGEHSTPVAAALRDRRVPFVFVSGYAPEQLGDPELQGVPWVRKPVQHLQLMRALRGVLGPPRETARET